MFLIVPVTSHHHTSECHRIILETTCHPYMPDGSRTFDITEYHSFPCNNIFGREILFFPHPVYWLSGHPVRVHLWDFQTRLTWIPSWVPRSYSCPPILSLHWYMSETNPKTEPVQPFQPNCVTFFKVCAMTPVLKISICFLQVQLFDPDIPVKHRMALSL